MFSVFIAAYLNAEVTRSLVTKSLDRSLVGHVRIVCGLHDRHKGQFGSTLPPSPFTGMEAGQQYGGADGGGEKEGLEGWSQTL